jgi:hypothetical protein
MNSGTFCPRINDFENKTAGNYGVNHGLLNCVSREEDEEAI